MPERKAGIFRSKEIKVISLRLTNDITIHSDPELTGSKTIGCCFLKTVILRFGPTLILLLSSYP